MGFCEEIVSSPTLHQQTTEEKAPATAEQLIQGSSLMSLPDEMLIRIFRFLSVQDICNRIVCVCRRFKIVSLDYSVLRNICISSAIMPKICDPAHRENMLSFVQNAFKLTSFTLMTDTNSESNLLVKTVAENCPHLKHLSVADRQLSAMTIELVVQQCPQLTTLRLHNSTLANCSRIAVLHSLRTLDFVSKGLIRDESNRLQCCNVIVEIVKGCSSLDELFICWLELTDAAQQCILVQPKSRWKGLGLCYSNILIDDMHLISECTQLEKLSLFNWYDYFYGLFIIVFPFKSLSKLKSLELFGFPDSESTDRLHELFRDCSFKDLLCLSIQNCPFGNDTLLGQIAASFPRLTSLDLRGLRAVTDAGLTEILIKCPEVTEIKIESLGVWTDGSCFFSNAPRLKTLDIIDCEAIEENIIDDLSNTTDIHINYTENSLLALREIFAET